MRYLVRDSKSEGPMPIDRFPEPPNDVVTVNVITNRWKGTLVFKASFDHEGEEWFTVQELTFDGKGSDNRMFNIIGRYSNLDVTINQDDKSVGRIDRVVVR